jgi:hypothetical protein
MKSTHSVAAFAVAFAAVLSLRVSAQAQGKTCSNTTLKGSYGYTGTQILTPPAIAGPFATVGRQAFDGQGNTTAAGTTSVNGQILKVTFTGTYNVNPDCTGSMTVLVLPVNITGHYYFVIDDDGTELRAISKDPGSVGSTLVRKQFLEACSNATLNGVFGYTNTGNITGGPDAGPFAGVGRQTFDGRGNTEATATVSVNGNVFSPVTIKGTYFVNPDCTGSLALTISAENEVFPNSVYFVIDEQGTEMRAIQADGGSVVTTIAKKLLPRKD